MGLNGPADLVRSFRRQEFESIDLPGIQTSYDAITGPTLANPTQVVENDATPQPLNFRQVCILDRSIGAKMNEYLVGVMVIKANQGKTEQW